MKRFKYSLQRVLDVREAAVSRCEALLAESERSLEARRKERRHCGEALRMASGDVEKQAQQKVLPFRECLAHRAWFEHLADRFQRAGRAMTEELAAVGERRDELQKAMMDHKVIENLSHRERCEWLQRMRYAEQKTMDEVASASTRRRSLSSKAARHSIPQSGKSS